jgi:toxin FitB
VIILDTDVLSALMRERPEQAIEKWLDRQPRESIWTTSVTILEIRFGLAVMPLGRRRAGLQREFEATLDQTLERRIVPFDSAGAEATAELMAARRQSGRTGALSDAMIAGIAIARRATLATRNTRHFADLPVPVVNPWAD